MPRKINVILPVYNEGAGIYNLLQKYSSLVSEFDFQIHVVNDCSRDDSLDWIESAKRDFKNLEINLINHATNQGLQGALRSGFGALRMDDGDLLVTMDGDNTHNPYLLREMVQKVDEGADIVIASRYCEQSRIAGLSKFRQILSYGAKILYSLIWRIDGAKDYTCLYRVYRGALVNAAIARYKDKLVEEKGFTCSPEILRKLATKQSVVVEAPMILVYSDKVGVSNMRILRTVGLTLKALFNR